MTAQERIVRQILNRRGLRGQALERFLSPDLSRDLHDPMLLPDIKPAIERLLLAKKRGEQVVVYGDYDIDGLCATTLLVRAFKEMDINVDAFIPNRFEHGYGLNQDALAQIKAQGASLIVTVDCGTTAQGQIAWAADHGLDVIVTDHHEPGDQLPSQAVAVINPKRTDSKYPWRELAGCGVAYKLVQAIQKHEPSIKAGSERWLLDLVAFATVCDVVPLLDENRTLAHFGLKLWPKTRWPGLKALSTTTGVRGSDVSATTLGYVFGPRLNAAGRIENAQSALQLLATNDPRQALVLAQELEGLNQARRAEQDKIEQDVLSLLDDLEDEPVIIAANAGWSHGVVGIVASKVMERTGKPTFLLQVLDDGTLKGSARSYGDFSVVEALNKARHLLISGGGHAAAGGLSLSEDKLDEFRKIVTTHYRQLNLKDQSQILKAAADITLDNLTDVNLDLIDLIGQLEPFGQDNPQPTFAIAPLTVVSRRRMGRDARHLRLGLADNAGQNIEAIMFNALEQPEVGGSIEVQARVQANDFGGRRRAELLLRSWRGIS